MKRCARCQTEKLLDHFIFLKGRGYYHSYCNPCRLQYAKDRRAAGKKAKTFGSTAKAWRVRERDTAYDHYGGKCVCCGETEYLFLTLDHVNDDGSGHRAKYRGIPMYTVAKREGYPDTLQLLCYNCNCGRSRNGGVCPHLAVSLEHGEICGLC